MIERIALNAVFRVYNENGFWNVYVLPIGLLDTKCNWTLRTSCEDVLTALAFVNQF